MPDPQVVEAMRPVLTWLTHHLNLYP